MLSGAEDKEVFQPLQNKQRIIQLTKSKLTQNVNIGGLALCAHLAVPTSPASRTFISYICIYPILIV